MGVRVVITRRDRPRSGLAEGPTTQSSNVMLLPEWTPSLETYTVQLSWPPASPVIPLVWKPLNAMWSTQNVSIRPRCPSA